MINEHQMRAGRALLGWTQGELASKSGISIQTINRMEKIGLGRSTMDNVVAVQKALEAGGLIFLGDEENIEGGPGVRLLRETKL